MDAPHACLRGRHGDKTRVRLYNFLKSNMAREQKIAMCRDTKYFSPLVSLLSLKSLPERRLYFHLLDLRDMGCLWRVSTGFVYDPTIDRAGISNKQSRQLPDVSATLEAFDDL
ncbi:hypothetical protein AVEN_117724-1 [Araneus ventricosus]|uniref:Uncharacterized protein n=1 Tax=Araneus ventricosus TaxID=182803 RepID=A0A4Y2P6T8_ARAVE|nr:hypothetical protein AVEN_141269-1 [Araneus ventricosus]GBN46150.1 hypothetical protein AVEN_117724-1 [Araneus ventricosus]